MSIADLASTGRSPVAAAWGRDVPRPVVRGTGRPVLARVVSGEGDRGMTTVAVIDGSAVARAALPRLLPGFAVSGTFAGVESFLALRPPADLLLVDIASARGTATGAEAVHTLVQAGYRVCVYTDDRRPALLARCLAAGACGVIAKADPVESLAAALTRIAGGGTAISPGLADIAALAQQLPALSKRQLEILSARARSEAFHEIGHRLGISARTAQDHWSVIARRFEGFLRTHSPADLERSLGLDGPAAPLDGGEPQRRAAAPRGSEPDS